MKAENIIIDEQLKIQLIDFGLGCFVNDHIEPEHGRVGTPTHMPPEMLESK